MGEGEKMHKTRRRGDAGTRSEFRKAAGPGEGESRSKRTFPVSPCHRVPVSRTGRGDE